MSDHPPSGPPAAHGTSGYPVAPGGFPGPQAGSPPWPPAPPRGQSRGLTFLALALAVVASGLAIVGWFRPSPAPPPTPAPAKSSTPTYTEEQISDAKVRSCKAFDLVDKGVTLQTNGESSSDPVMAKAQGASARLATISGGWYLKARLDPATPAELTSAIQHLSDVLLDLGANYEAGVRDDDASQAALKNETNSTFAHVAELCK